MRARLPRTGTNSLQLRQALNTARRFQSSQPGESSSSSASTSTPATSSTSQSKSNVPNSASPASSSSSSSSSTSVAASLPEKDRRPPILPFYPVPKPPQFPTRFKAHPGYDFDPTESQASFINFPYPAWRPRTEDQQPKEFIGGSQRDRNETVLSAITGLSVSELRQLKRMSIAVQRVSHMSKKGRTRSYVAWQLVGDPQKGMVGLGRGSGDNVSIAIDKAFTQACKNLDYVDRYENRTVWGQGADLVGKFKSTEVYLRARPPGFGLFVPHSIHRVLSTCGIKDCSATIMGSTHLVNVTKCVIQMLHGGANPPGYGTGFGRGGRVENKGMAMRSKQEIERARGRYGVDIGRRV